MKEAMLEQMQATYAKLALFRTYIDILISQEILLTDSKLIFLNNSYDRLALQLMNQRNEFESIFGEKVVFYDIKNYEKFSYYFV